MSLHEDQGLGNGNVILFCLEVVLNLESDKLIYTPNNKNKKKKVFQSCSNNNNSTNNNIILCFTCTLGIKSSLGINYFTHS